MQLFNLISTRQFQDRSLLEQLFATANRLEQRKKDRNFPQTMAGLIMATMFYEPSTRTHFSFEVATLKLGGQVVGTENAGEFSSAAKGETTADTARVLSGYVDGIIIRHTKEGEVAKAAQHATVPVINAGDGAGEHPTQALLDLFTIQQEKGSLDGHHIVLVGDLRNGRTIHSLVQLLPLFQVREVILVAPPSMQLPSEYLAYLVEGGITVQQTTNLDGALPDADVVYMTRIQKERFFDPDAYDEVKDCYCLDLLQVAMMKTDAIIMHPLPRLTEIPIGVDNDPRARYFEQAEHGLYMRMALLHEMYVHGGLLSRN